MRVLTATFGVRIMIVLWRTRFPCRANWRQLLPTPWAPRSVRRKKREYRPSPRTIQRLTMRICVRGRFRSAGVLTRKVMSRVQRALGHWDEAVANLQRAIELDPRDVRASNNLALTYCAMRRFPEALATLDRVLAWAPTNARALLTKADALVGIGDLQAAEPLLANPDVPPDRRAQYALFQRNYAAAVEILSKDLAVERGQRDPEDILSLAFSQ